MDLSEIEQAFEDILKEKHERLKHRLTKPIRDDIKNELMPICREISTQTDAIGKHVIM